MSLNLTLQACASPIKHTQRLRTVMSSTTPPRNKLNVAVLGGGAAGLVAARELLREGQNVTVYEQSNRIGGVWVYTDVVEDDPLGLSSTTRQHGSMYRSLRTNLPREVMGFSDFPFDDKFPGSQDSRQFCTHDEVLRYIEAFADHYKLHEYVQLNTHVASVRPVENNESTKNNAWHKYKVQIQQQHGTTQELLYDAVIVCNGHYSEPVVPHWPGQDIYTGYQMHSHNYRTPDRFTNQTVLLIGASSSGTDLAEELVAGGAKRVLLSARSWENPLTGEALADQLSSSVDTVGSVVKLPNVVRLGPGKEGEFEGGIVIDDIDSVMYCTGYSYKFPFLEGSAASPQVIDNRVCDLYKHVFLPLFAPTLSFIGLPWKILPFPQFELQAKWISRCLSGRSQLPTQGEMEIEAAKFYAELDEQGFAYRYTHRQVGDVQWEYNRFLIQQCGNDVPDWAEWRSELYFACGRSRKVNGADKYRDQPLPDAAEAEKEARRDLMEVRQALERSNVAASAV